MSQRYRRDDREPGKGPKRRDCSRRSTGFRRFQVAEERIWIGWWERGQFLALACLLREIGQDGAVVVAPELPPMERTVWLRLERGGASIGSVQGTFDSASPVGPGRVTARLRFAEPCPESLLHAAVMGLQAHQAALN